MADTTRWREHDESNFDVAKDGKLISFLDQSIPTLGEGFAFAHCTTCKAPYHLRVHVAADRKWRTLKFCFFVTRDILSIFMAVQLVIASLAYLVYLIDGYQKSCLRLAWGFDNELSFYCICGALLSFALLGLSGCFITCYDRQVRDDLAQPCRELCLCCCQPGMCADCHLPGTLCIWTDCTTCFESCASAATECGCLGGAGEAGLPLLFIMALIVLGLFTVIEIFYSVLVATMVGQRIWQRNYHILAKRMLTIFSVFVHVAVPLSPPVVVAYVLFVLQNLDKLDSARMMFSIQTNLNILAPKLSFEYGASLFEHVVEDVDGEMIGSDWSPTPLPPEHVHQLKTLGLLISPLINWGLESQILFDASG
ncbi:RNA-binding (RRM/RBD/RNP motifs) family protein [Hibiscus syriacus]|uniref:RNA-binding (RRM/RBD/RNP motifs) family protein n=1 Tax=Hibiscus syriacus TaxID=106335 RepID=A0A6A3CG97_HIBSY|nr:RNA-binding (RRM/RBD/RNP motifs) family protein [Hibiscus syriacus]